MESKLEHLIDRLVPKQRALEFTQPDQWQHLPRVDKQACCRAIAELLCHVVTQTLDKESE